MTTESASNPSDVGSVSNGWNENPIAHSVTYQPEDLFEYATQGTWSNHKRRREKHQPRESDYLVVICAHNEARNLPLLLKVLSDHPVLVVDDGSIDGTAAIAKAANVNVLTHPSRLGKTTALKDGIQFAVDRGCSIVVDIGGDAIPAPDAVVRLLTAVQEEPDIGGSSARQIPTQSGSRIAYMIDEVIWAVLANGKEYQMRRFNDSYLGAVMFAFKPSLIRLADVTNDDEFVGAFLKSKGLRVVFVSNAVVHFDGSRSLHHILERRRRMLYGHINQPESGAPSRSKSLAILALAYSVRERPRRGIWMIPAILIEFAARAQAWRDFRQGRSTAYKNWLTVHKHRMPQAGASIRRQSNGSSPELTEKSL